MKDRGVPKLFFFLKTRENLTYKTLDIHPIVGPVASGASYRTLWIKTK